MECKRNDGKRWRCRRPVMDGKQYCEAHFLQYSHRLKREPVPDALKLVRSRRKTWRPKLVQISPLQLGEEHEAPLTRGRKRNVTTSLPRKRGRPVVMKEDIVEISDQLEGGSKLTFHDGNLHLYKIKHEHEESVGKDLMFGQMVIPQLSPMPPQSTTLEKEASPKVKAGISSATKVSKRTIRSENIESDPIATVQVVSHTQICFIYNLNSYVFFAYI